MKRLVPFVDDGPPVFSGHRHGLCHGSRKPDTFLVSSGTNHQEAGP